MANISTDDLDNEMQEWLDKGVRDTPHPDFDQADLASYIVLNDILEKKPVGSLSPQFAANVAIELDKRYQKRISFRYSFILPVAMLLIVAIYYIAASYTKSVQSGDIVALIWKFKWYMVFAIVCFLSIQFFDRLLVKRKHLDFI